MKKKDYCNGQNKYFLTQGSFISSVETQVANYKSQHLTKYWQVPIINTS